MLEEIKLELGISDDTQDDLLGLYIKKASKSIFTHINNKRLSLYTIQQKYDDVICDIVCNAYRFRNLKNKDAGIKSKQQGERSVTYMDEAHRDLFVITDDLASRLPSPFVELM